MLQLPTQKAELQRAYQRPRAELIGMFGSAHKTLGAPHESCIGIVRQRQKQGQKLAAIKQGRGVMGLPAKETC